MAALRYKVKERNMSVSYLDKMVAKLISLGEGEKPRAVVEMASACLLDTLGCMLAGGEIARTKLEAYIRFCGPGAASPVGFSRHISVQDVAFVNAIAAHVAELDDGHRRAMMHIGAPVISGLLADMQNGGVEAEDFLRGIIVGYEAAIRLAELVQPEHKKRGYHATGTCGAFGAAMGVAAMRRLDAACMKNAASAALAGAGGLLEMIEGSSELKPYNCARAAADAIRAVNTARSEFCGPLDALGGRRGFLTVLGHGVDEAAFGYALNDEWRILSVYRKPYAACRHTHAAIEAALRICTRNPLKPEDIRAIHVQTYDLAVFGHDHVDIEGVNSAKMSIPYSVAVAVCEGKAGLSEFTAQKITDTRVLSLTKKVAVQENPELSALVPEKRAAIVEIVDASGESYKAISEYPKGEPENPMTPEELEKKFFQMASYAHRDEAWSKSVIQAVKSKPIALPKLCSLLFESEER